MKKLSPKQKKDREAQLNEWLKNKDELFDKWIVELPKSIKSDLDFSVGSLNSLGKYLITRFSNPDEIENNENKEEIFMITGYVLEVFLKNLKNINWEWGISDCLERTAGKYYYPFNIGDDRNSLNIFSILPSIIYKKEDWYLETYFKLNQASVNGSNQMMDKAVVMPGKGGYSYQYFILIRDESFQLSKIEQGLKAYYAKKGQESSVFFHNDGHLLVKRSEDYYFHFQLDTSEGVLEESKEISESYKGAKDKSVIAACKSRVEFWGDEDPDGDYLNDHMFILEQVIKNDKLMIFDFQNGVFFDEI